MEKNGNRKTLAIAACVVVFVLVLFTVAFWQLGGIDWIMSLQQGSDQSDTPSEDQTQQEPPSDVTQPVNWGDDIGGRPAYSEEDVAGGALGDKVVLNSRTYEDGFLSDMRQFVRVMRVVQTEDGGAQAVLCNEQNVTVEEGLYLLNAYIQNDNPGTVSENTRVGFGIPTSHGVCLNVSGWIFSDNGTATEMWHKITLSCERQFHLEYKYGSALLWRKGLGDSGKITLPDAIVTKIASENGTPVGWTDDLNGELPGGEEYLLAAQIAVRVVYDEAVE